MPGLDQMLWRIVAWSSDEPLCTWVHIIYTHEYVYVYIYMCIYIYVCICIEYFLGHIYIYMCMYVERFQNLLATSWWSLAKLSSNSSLLVDGLARTVLTRDGCPTFA